MLRKILPLTLAALLLTPAVAYGADVPDPQTPLALPSVQVWALLAGSLAPLVGYVLNHYAPWCNEPVKALVQVAIAALVGAITQQLDAGTFALDLPSLEIVGTAVIGALLAHKALWLPAGISGRLGGGTNAMSSAAT